MGVSRLTLALALEVGSPTRLRSPYIPQKFEARPMQIKYMLGLNTHKKTIDVANLYGNIPVQEAIEATIKHITKHEEKIDLLGLDKDTIKTLLAHCLTNNYVRFGQQFYKQNQGIAMGSRMAPPLAIIFMDGRG